MDGTRPNVGRPLSAGKAGGPRQPADAGTPSSGWWTRNGCGPLADSGERAPGAWKPR